MWEYKANLMLNVLKQRQIKYDEINLSIYIVLEDSCLLKIENETSM